MHRNKFVLLFLTAFSFLSVLAFAFNASLADELPVFVMFHSPNCHACIEVKEKFMPALEEKYKERIKVDYLDLTDVENYKYFLSLKEKYGFRKKAVTPIFFLQGNFFSEQSFPVRRLESFIERSLKNPVKAAGELPEVDLLKRFSAFKPLVIMSAGLIDGINPCAFTVIIFFISFLAVQGYRRRELFFIGISFILAVFLTYVLIGLGALQFFYKLEAFWLVSRWVNVAVGFFSIILGFLALYDLAKYLRTRQTEGMLLQLPKAVKNQIHKVIGIHYRKEKPGAVNNRKITALVLSAFATGFLVSLLEAVCTGQTYLPTITFILKSSELKLRAFSYLIIYNFMFIFPLGVIFFLSLLGVSSQDFSRFLKRHLATAKFLMAVLFFGLGLLLVQRG